MSDEKKNFDQLSLDELGDVKGGIPYEKPELLELSEGVTSCSTGVHCDSGFNGGERCATGLVCSTGSHGPGIPPPK